MKRIKFGLLCLFLCLLSMTACSSNSGSGSSSSMSALQRAENAAPAPAAAPMPTAAPMLTGGYGGYSDEGAAYEPQEQLDAEIAAGESTAKATTPENKIIFTGNIFMETLDFDQVLEQIQLAVEQIGGYVASSNLHNYKSIQSRDYRSYSITLKVPVEAYRETFAYLKTLGKVLSSDETAQDVTAEYYDLESRLKTKQVEEERVLDMITRAEKIEDLIALEQRLGQIRTDIEVFETQLRNLARLTSYSTINMTLNEIDEGGILAVSDDFGVRLKRSFDASINGTLAFFENCIVFLAGAAIPLLIILCMALAVFAVYKRR